MLRLETKISGKRTIKRSYVKEDGTVQTSVTTDIPTYDNRIKETLAFMPRNHYLTLVSVHVPFSPFENIGDIKFYLKDREWELKSSYENQKISSVQDLIDHLYFMTFHAEIIDNRFCFVIHDDVPSSMPHAKEFKIEMSAQAAWLLGFSQTCYAGEIGQTIRADHKNPPIFTRYLQILCHNVGGSRDSNMTFPEAIAIYPLVSPDSMYTPNVVINNRLEKGKVLDIEILDQDNRPFVHAPVYLEFYVSDEAEHEKKQGFFRFEKDTKLILAEPVTKISIPYIYAFSRLQIPVKWFVVWMFCKTDSRDLYLNVGHSLFRHCILTRSAILQNIVSWNRHITNQLPNSNLYIKPHFENNILILETNFKEITLQRTYINEIAKKPKDKKQITFSYNRSARIEIRPECLYTQDQRLLIFCKEYNDAEPIAVARRNMSTFRIINPNFWSWHELEKPTKTLTFHYQLISNHGDGLITTVSILPGDSEIVTNLFYK